MSKMNWQNIKDGMVELAIEEYESIVIIRVKDAMYRPVGFLVLDIKKGALTSILVDEPYRNRGIATLLIKEAEEIAREKNLDRLQIAIHPDNQDMDNLASTLGYDIRLLVLEKRL